MSLALRSRGADRSANGRHRVALSQTTSCARAEPVALASEAAKFWLQLVASAEDLVNTERHVRRELRTKLIASS
jgi:hypothetical protein